MRLGLFMMPLHDPRRDLPTLLREDQEAILLAERLGFDEAWVGEHLTASTEPIASPLIFLASLIAKTERIRLGTGVMALPHHHPAVVAGHCALFDHLSGGRLLLGIGPGGLPSDIELFGLLGRDDRGQRMVDARSRAPSRDRARRGGILGRTSGRSRRGERAGRGRHDS